MKNVLVHNLKIKLPVPIMVAYHARKQMIKMNKLVNFVKEQDDIILRSYNNKSM